MLIDIGQRPHQCAGDFGAMISAGDWKLGGVAWGVILIPLALTWIVGSGVGRVVHWVAAGIRR
jgi:hypothetical protein